ncbi:Methyl-accepting chemotaxis protein (MCP) signalling domain-containing protein [Marinobacter sp. es.048]|nr:Methyl-accepting chemotaxis protein (MCP) signalling domain-containing protein [Marinobacter sp. es.048]
MVFGHLTVAKRLALGFGLILSLVIAVSLIGNQRVGFIDRTLTDVGDGAAVKQRYAINDMNAQIASASEEQSSVAEEVNRNISRIHDATVETSAGSEQVAGASRDLAVLAGQLRSLVSVFRFKG